MAAAAASGGASLGGGRERNEIRRLVWGMELIYEKVSKSMIATKIVMEMLGWCCRISLANSTIGIVWWELAAGYKRQWLLSLFSPHRLKRGERISR